MNKNEIEYLVKDKNCRRPKWTALDKLINYKTEVKQYDKFLKDVQAKGLATFEQKGNYLLFQKSTPLSEINPSPSMDQQFRQIADIRSSVAKKSKLSSVPGTEQRQVSFFNFGLTDEKEKEAKKSSYFSSPIVKIKAFMSSIITSVEKKIRK